MFFFSHIIISKALYSVFTGEVEIDKQAFRYGNIKPDIPSQKRNRHTLESCLTTVCNYSEQIMEEKLSLMDFSVRLGEVCHYVCDFFCYYHLNNEIHDRRLNHFLYELRLHYKLLELLSSHRLKASHSGVESSKDIYSIILEMRKDYLSRPQSMENDINYAVLTSVRICECIIYCMKYPTAFTENEEIAINSLLIPEGGNL